MPLGLRLGSATVDLDSFRAFVEARGAVQTTPHDASGEVLRFRIDKMVGFVARKKNGVLTFAGVARPMVERWMEDDRAKRIAGNGEAA